MSTKRIIKKYPNRRLYDTEKSQYITLEDIKELVLKYNDVCILDSQTEEEITNSVLLQIINELENSSTPIFTTEILKNIIRFYGNELQGVVSQYIEKGMALFSAQQNSFQEGIDDIVKYNVSVWQSNLEKLMSSSSTNHKPKQKPKNKT